MGQYYLPVIIDGSELILYNRNVDGQYGMAKLMEHSWINNPIVNKVCGHIYHHPCRIAWVGDYHEVEIPHIPITGNEAWERLEAEGIELNAKPIKVDGKMLVNHSKKLYVDFDEYIKTNTEQEWCVHPLSLLTACGNGAGGGDYYGCSEYDVGEWAGDLISLEDNNWNIPANYEAVEYEFKERM